MNPQLKTVTVRITNCEDGSVRAWSDDLPGLMLSCAGYDVLFAELAPCIADLLKKQGFDSKLVREIHQYIYEVQTIDQR
jgi:hypothetical protein